MKRYDYKFNKKWGAITLPFILCALGALMSFFSITWERGALKQALVTVRKGAWTFPDTLMTVMPLLLLAMLLIAVIFDKRALFAFAPLPVIYGLACENADKLTKCTVYLSVPCVAFFAVYILLCTGLLPRAGICSAVCALCALYFPVSVAFDFVPLLESYNFSYGASYKLSQTAAFFFMFMAIAVFCLGLVRTKREHGEKNEYSPRLEAGSTGDALKEDSHVRAEDDIIK